MKKCHKIEKIAFVKDCFELKVDGKEYKFQLADISERLAKATPEERENYEILQSDYGIHWPLIDEDLSIDCLIAVKQPYKPTDMAGAPKAFEYELQMFLYSVEFCQNLALQRKAMIETSLLHARNLMDFFTGKPSQNDDILAYHFVGKSLKIPYLESLRNDINKSLSHLTYTRLSPGQRYEWDLAKIKDEIEAVYIEFLKLLPEEDRARWPTPKNS